MTIENLPTSDEVSKHHRELMAHMAMKRYEIQRRKERRRRVMRLLILPTLLVLFLLMRSSSAQASTASCYGPGLYGNQTASGVHLWVNTLGVAHKTLPFGTKLWIKSEGRLVKVPVIDRGPFVAGRSLDLTEATVLELGHNGCTSWGVRKVRTWRARS